MKFIRYGTLSPQKAKRWSADGKAMPAPRGIYAFPFGYLDYFYIWPGKASDAQPRVQYVKDESGRRLLLSELLARLAKEDPQFRDLRNIYFGHVRWQEVTSPLALHLRKTYRLESIGAIFGEERKSWVMVMDDPRHPPRLTHDPHDPTLTPEQVEAIPLDQKLQFLKGEDGKKIPAENFFCVLEWEPDRFWDDFRPASWDEVSEDEFLYKQTKKVVDSPFRRALRHVEEQSRKSHDDDDEAAKRKIIRDWLARQGLSLERLCPWPVYPKDRWEWAVVHKEPHTFEYSGCLWHKLRKTLPPGEIIRSVGDWCYTTIGAYEKALKAAEPMLYARHKGTSQKGHWHGGLENCGYGNKHVPNEYCCFEVFIDAKLVERKQNG